MSVKCHKRTSLAYITLQKDPPFFGSIAAVRQKRPAMVEFDPRVWLSSHSVAQGNGTLSQKLGALLSIAHRRLPLAQKFLTRFTRWCLRKLLHLLIPKFHAVLTDLSPAIRGGARRGGGLAFRSLSRFSLSGAIGSIQVGTTGWCCPKGMAFSSSRILSSR